MEEFIDTQSQEELEGQEGQEAQEPVKKPASKFMSYIASVVSGSILGGAEAMGVYRHVIKVVFVLLLSMTNVYSMYSLYRKQTALKREIKQLRSKSVTLSSKVISSTRQSEVIRELKNRGIAITASRTPHKVLE